MFIKDRFSFFSFFKRFIFYVEGGLTQAKKAQEVFEKVLNLTYKEDIEDAEIIEDKFNVIKGLFPNVADEVIKYVISILESKTIK